MGKNNEFVGIDEKYVPDDNYYSEDELNNESFIADYKEDLQRRNDDEKREKKAGKLYISFIAFFFVLIFIFFIIIFITTMYSFKKTRDKMFNVGSDNVKNIEYSYIDAADEDETWPGCDYGYVNTMTIDI